MDTGSPEVHVAGAVAVDQSTIVKDGLIPHATLTKAVPHVGISTTQRLRRWKPLSVGAGFAALVALGALVPVIFSTVWVNSLANSLAYSLVVLSVVVLAKATGSISLAQASFMGIGAYLFGWLFISASVPFIPSAIIAVLVVIGIGMLLTFPALRLRGIELTVLTLAVAIAAGDVVFNPGAPLSVGLAGAGVSLTHSVTLFGVNLSASERSMYWFVLAVVVIAFAAIGVLLRGRVGHTWTAMQKGRAPAASVGISITRYQVLGFAVSSGLAALAGVLLLCVQTSLTADYFGPTESVLIVVVAVAVGLNRISSAIIGELLLVHPKRPWVCSVFPRAGSR